MINIQEAAKDTFWIGGSDRRLSRFENLFPLPQGVSYNSYVVKDEKAVVFDTADVSVAGQYLENLETALAGASPSYLVILHMEPDHCALLQTFVSRYPDVVLVGSAQTFRFIGQFFPELGGQKKQIVKDGDTLVTGAHTFRFMTAPMVHWPEVLFAYDEYTKALFSADAFGTFGAPGFWTRQDATMPISSANTARMSRRRCARRGVWIFRRFCRCTDRFGAKIFLISWINIRSGVRMSRRQTMFLWFTAVFTFSV